MSVFPGMPLRTAGFIETASPFPTARHVLAVFLSCPILRRRCARRRSAMGGTGIGHIGAVVAAVLLATLAMPILARAQSAPAVQSEEAQANELKAAWVAGALAATEGPADITLIDQATLKLPAGYDFIPKAEGARILQALGNRVGESTFVGLVVGTKPSDEWIVATRYVKEGYIKDDDAKHWNADELLQNI